MTHRSDTDRLEWLIDRIQAAEEEMLAISDTFRWRGKWSEDTGVIVALNTLRDRTSLPLTSVRQIDAAMDAETP